MRQFSHEMRVAAPPAAVLDAFFNAKALGEWWGASSSRCEPRPLGEYVIAWAASSEDQALVRSGAATPSRPPDVMPIVLGPDRQGELRGTVMEFRPGREFFVAELFWTRVGAPPTGPMALEASCVTRDLDSALTIRYSAADEAPGWALHRHELARLVPREMMALKSYLERLFSIYTR
jgi:hypothetical protein